MQSQDTELGREVVRSGQLQSLRVQLGLTRNAMAERLETAALTYTKWERQPDTNLWPRTAERVGRFFRIAQRELELLQEAGVDLRGLVPFHVVATQMGLPQETLLRMYRDEEFEAIDLGILGLWVEQQELDRLRRR